MAVSVKNITPLPHLKFSNTDNQGREFGVLMLKAAFDIADDGACTLSQEQEPFNFTDLTYGELNASSLRHPADTVSYKPTTDVIVDAITHAPDGQARPSWECGLRVQDEFGNEVKKALSVYGPRHWVPRWRKDLEEEQRRHWRNHKEHFERWELSEALPIASLPIRYEYAFGGTIAKGLDADNKPVLDAYAHNPVGCGLIDRDWTDHTQALPAPQIENLYEKVVEPYKLYHPDGFGPIPPAWQPRRKLGGTFDKNWLDNIWPKWPPDYDFTYNNSAPESMRPQYYFRGNLQVHLWRLRRQHADFILNIPDLMPLVVVETQAGDERLVQPNLDTLFLEIAEDDWFDCRVTITWRLVFHREETESLFFFLPNAEQRRKIAAEPETLHSAQHPSTCAVPCKDLELT